MKSGARDSTSQTVIPAGTARSPRTGSEWAGAAVGTASAPV
jgi:hypothetical protein